MKKAERLRSDRTQAKRFWRYYPHYFGVWVPDDDKHRLGLCVGEPLKTEVRSQRR